MQIIIPPPQARTSTLKGGTRVNETLKTIHGLRSVRRFSRKEIPEEDLTTILNAAVRAANAGGRQGYAIVVVRDRAAMKHFGYVGSRLLVFCVDYNRIADTADALGYTFSIGGSGLSWLI